MAFTPVLCAQLAISSSSILMNALGIYCLNQRKKGNRNQLALQKNLAYMDIIKTIYDYVPWAIYHFNTTWYEKNLVCLEIMEVNMTTLMFCCFLFITLDRLLCVLLSVTYTTHVNIERIHNLIISMWILGMTPGVFLWGIFKSIGKAKVYYYLAFDCVIISLIVTTYSIIINSIRKRSKDLSLNNSNSTFKMQAVAVLLMASFIICNGIPDVVYLFHQDDRTYHAISLLWTLGYLLDPVIYIFTANEMREIAKTSLLRLFCWRRGGSGIRASASWFTGKSGVTHGTSVFSIVKKDKTVEVRCGTCMQKL